MIKYFYIATSNFKVQTEFIVFLLKKALVFFVSSPTSFNSNEIHMHLLLFAFWFFFHFLFFPGLYYFL